MKKYNLYIFDWDGTLSDSNINDLPNIKLFDGVLETLLQLKKTHHYIAIATGASRKTLDLYLESLNITNLFDFTITACQASSKPNPEMLECILSNLGFLAKDAIMIGDSFYDSEMAKAINMDFALIDYSKKNGNDSNNISILSNINMLIK